MKTRSFVLAPALAMAPAVVAAQAQITTGAIDGTVLDQTGAVVPGTLVEAKNVDTNFSRSMVSAGDGRFLFLQMPSGAYTVTFTLSGFATLVQDGLVLTVGQTMTPSTHAPDLGRPGDHHRHRVGHRRHGPDGKQHDAEPAHGGDDTEPGSKVRRSPHPHPQRRHRPGAGRRLDHLRRAARDLQQHLARRRGLQQRLLRRAGRWPARGHRRHPRCDQGVPGRGHRGERRIRAHRRRRRERDHEVGHERAAWRALLLWTRRIPDRRPLGRNPARGLQPPAVRRHSRRPHQEGQALLLRRRGEHQQRLHAAESSFRLALPAPSALRPFLQTKTSSTPAPTAREWRC